MRLRHAILTTVFMLLAAFHAAALADKSSRPVATVGYPLGNASLFDFRSEKADRDLQILVSLPGSYNASSERRYPVIYAVDGQWHFTLASAAAGALHYDRGWPESIVVGITWKGNVQDAERLRYQDFTPTTIEAAPETGRADRYLDFLQDELLPYMAEHYRVSDDRVLMGSSLGGLLSLYCLFTRPQLFSDYIASTPATWWDDNVLDRYRKAFDGHALEHPVRLYVSRGESEHSMQSGADTMAAELQQADFANLDVAFATVPGTGHAALNPEVITRGLQFIFRKEWVQLTGDQKQEFAGIFEAEGEERNLVIRSGGGRLYTTSPEFHSVIELVAVEPDRFFLADRGAELVFHRDDEGRADRVVVTAPGHEQTFRRSAGNDR